MNATLLAFLTSTRLRAVVVGSGSGEKWLGGPECLCFPGKGLLRRVNSDWEMGETKVIPLISDSELGLSCFGRGHSDWELVETRLETLKSDSELGVPALGSVHSDWELAPASLGDADSDWELAGRTLFSLNSDWELRCRSWVSAAPETIFPRLTDFSPGTRRVPASTLHPAAGCFWRTYHHDPC